MMRTVCIFKIGAKINVVHEQRCPIIRPKSDGISSPHSNRRYTHRIVRSDFGAGMVFRSNHRWDLWAALVIALLFLLVGLDQAFAQDSFQGLGFLPVGKAVRPSASERADTCFADAEREILRVRFQRETPTRQQNGP
jgi:hypothetical protein